MKLFQKIIDHKEVKSIICGFTIFFLMNNLLAFGSENKAFSFANKLKDNDFEETFFKNSIKFYEYDNLESQLKVFFGGFDRSEKIFYPDLSIIRDSDALREMYKSKLNDMGINEIFSN